MKNRSKKTLSLFIALGLTLAAFTGCGTKNNNDTKDAQTQTQSNSGEPYEIKLLLGTDPTKPYDASKDVVKANVEKALNVKFIPEFVDVQQYKQKLNLKIASSDLPDFIKIDFADDFLKYAPQGLFYDLTDKLNEKNTPNLTKEVPKEVFDLVKVKGKIYGVPIQTGPGAGYRWNLTMRKDFLETIGEKTPKSLEEYYYLLKKIKAAKPDVIPLGAYNQNIGEVKYANNSFDHIFGAFGVTPGYFYVDGGNINNYDINPKMKEALTFIQKMNKEGLIDKEYASIKETNLKDKLFAGKLFSWMGWWSTPTDYDKQIEIFEMRATGKLGKDDTIKEDRSNDPYKYLNIMGSLVGSDGKAVAPAGAQFSQVFAINAKTKDPQKLLNIVEKANSLENKMIAIWGTENEDYVIENNKLQRKLELVDIKSNVDPKGNYRGVEIYNLTSSLNGYPRYIESTPLRRAQSLEIAIKNPYQITDASNFLTSATKLQKYRDLCTLRDGYFTQIIMGADISKFDEFVSKWKAQGGDEIIKELQTSYNENKK